MSILCQRPKRALFISTKGKELTDVTLIIEGVNALNGLFSFLRSVVESRTGRWKFSVNARNGLFSFLRCNNWVEYASATDKCQRPKRALFISTGQFFTSL